MFGTSEELGQECRRVGVDLASIVPDAIEESAVERSPTPSRGWERRRPLPDWMIDIFVDAVGIVDAQALCAALNTLAPP